MSLPLPPNLSRWNRAGLSRFRYVDGNAVEFLESVRKALREKKDQRDSETGLFKGWPDVVAKPPVSKETPDQAKQRLQENYLVRSRDMGWEIARVIARASHVLGEYIDAYANEGFLRTATQWDSVRRLVAMLGYQPHPPASATTPMVLKAKPDKSGRIKRGALGFKAQPPEGAAVVFENLSELDIDSAFNELRPFDYDRSNDRIGEDKWLTLDGKIEGIKIGTPVVLEAASEASSIFVSHIADMRVTEDASEIRLASMPSAEEGAGKYTLGTTLVHISPQEQLSLMGPSIGGASVEMIGKSIYLEDKPDQLARGNVVLISDGETKLFRRIAHVAGHKLTLDRSLKIGLDGKENQVGLNLDRAYVKPAPPVSVVDFGGRKREQDSNGVWIRALRLAGDYGYLTGEYIADMVVVGQKDKKAVTELKQFMVESAKYTPVAVPGEGAAKLSEDAGYTVLTVHDPNDLLRNPQAIFMAERGVGLKVDSFLQNSDSKNVGDRGRLALKIETSLPKKMVAGDFVVLAAGERLAAARIKSVDPSYAQGAAQLNVDSWVPRKPGRFYFKQTSVLGHFKHQARLKGWNVNKDKLEGPKVTVPLPIGATPPSIGRTLLIAQDSDDGPAKAFKTVISRIVPALGYPNCYDLEFFSAIPGDAGFTHGNTLIFGNVADAGHGERKPEKVLGSGNAAVGNQHFILDASDVSFVADPSQTSGVRADIELRVDGEMWDQVASFDSREPSDKVFRTAMLEQGGVLIEFGDGIHGHRVPTGENNVRAGYRAGAGLSGNLPAGSLIKLAQAHALVESVLQPMPSTGGNDVESAGSMRQHAPASVLTLDRAVSVDDFSGLLVRHSSVWQARAFERPGRSRHDSHLELVVVPAGGAPLEGLKQTLLDFITANGVPGARVVLTEYKPVSLVLNVTIGVISKHFDPEAVVAQVKQRLLAAFTLRERVIGQAVFLSEVYEIVENVAGVEYSKCGITGAVNHGQVLMVQENEVAFLDTAKSALTVLSEEYTV